MKTKHFNKWNISHGLEQQQEEEEFDMGMSPMMFPSKNSVELDAFFYNTIFINGDITQKTLTQFYKAVHLLNMEDTVYLVINSNGGDLSSALSMAALLRNIRQKTTVVTQALGVALSAGALLLSCGTKGHRYATPTSIVMAHAVQIATGYGNLRTEIGPLLGSVLYLDNQLLEIMAQEITKKVNESISPKQLERNKKKLATIFHGGDKYFTAEEAKELGIIDHVDSVILPSGFIELADLEQGDE